MGENLLPYVRELGYNISKFFNAPRLAREQLELLIHNYIAFKTTNKKSSYK